MQIDASAKNTTRDSCIVPNPCSESKYAVSKAIPSSPQLSFSKEETAIIDRLWELEQSNVISFNDMEYDVAAKVIQEMFDKAYTSATMDYELIFWGYTFAIKKITWFAQAIDEFSICTIEDKKSLLYHNLDPMFNIKSARFFQGTAENLMEQMINFCVFDTKHLMKNERAIEAPTLKWNQFFRTPWANSVEVKKTSFLLYNKYF